MNFKLVTLLGVKVDKEIYEVILPTSEGAIAVFPSHEPLVALAVPGVVSIRYNKNDDDKKMEHFAISGGIIKISQNLVRLLVDEAAHGEEIVESEVREALERAKKLRAEAKDQIELDKAHELVDRHAVQLKVAELHRHHHQQKIHTDL